MLTGKCFDNQGDNSVSTMQLPDSNVNPRTSRTNNVQPATKTLDPASDSSTEPTYFDKARAKLEAHARTWENRPLVRELYAGYHRMIEEALSAVAGANLEVGSGTGQFATYMPNTLLCDLVPCSWLDLAADATHLPFNNETLANLILLDVLHHIDDVRRFFAETQRTLAPGGRIIMVEPYSSPISWLAWRFIHEEDIDHKANPLEGPALTCPNSDDPWTANIAIPTLLFWRDLTRFHTEYPGLRVVTRHRFDTIVMPLSGGFEQRPILPHFLAPFMRVLERAISPLNPILAYRCFVVVEKK